MESLLRDINREHSKMQADVENLNRHFEKLHNYLYQHLQRGVTEWARLVLNHPHVRILIVETTSIYDQNGYAQGESEPIRLTTLAPLTGEIWDQLLVPTHSKSIAGAEYHGLTTADLLGKPNITDAWPAITEALAEKHLIIFGADWAQTALSTVHPTTNLLGEAVCLHGKSKEYYNEFYDLSLEKILSYQGINKTREELTNAAERISYLHQVIQNFATAMPKAATEEVQETSWTNASDYLDSEALQDLEDHPF